MSDRNQSSGPDRAVREHVSAASDEGREGLSIAASRSGDEAGVFALSAGGANARAHERSGPEHHRIYVASSWRNVQQQAVVATLRAAGHEVYDFKNPRPGDSGFSWRDCDEAWESWDPRKFRAMLDHPIARAGFDSDFDAMKWATAFVLVLPCGRSAHLELGWAVGAGKPTTVLLADGEPELMYRMVDRLCVDLDEVLAFLRTAERTSR